MKKLSLEQYQQEREKAIDAVIENASSQDNSAILNTIFPKHQAKIFEQMTHLKGEEFLESRRELYRKIFDNTFIKEGQLIQPTPQKKYHFLLVSSYGEYRKRLFEHLVDNNSSLPSHIRKIFNKVNNGHAVFIEHDAVMNGLPEYKAAKARREFYPSRIVYGEVKTIIDEMIKMSKGIGYNIIDRSSTHSYPKTTQQIEELKHTSSNPSTEYNITAIGLVKEPESVAIDPLEDHLDSSFSYVKNMAKLGLKRMAGADGFKELMKNTKNSLLLWDNGENTETKYRYSTVAAFKDGKFTFPRRDLLKKFDNFQHLKNIEHNFLNIDTYVNRNFDDAHASSTNLQKNQPWTEKETERHSNNQVSTGNKTR